MLSLITKDKKSRSLFFVLSGSFCAALSPLVLASENLSISLTYDAEYTDNALKEKPKSGGDFKNNVGIRFDSPWEYESEHWKINAFYNLGRTEYNNNSSESRFSASGSTQLQWMPLHYFSMLMTNRESNVIINPSAPNTANNITRQSEYSIGPQLSFTPNKTNSIQLSSVYQIVDPHDADSDSERLNTSLNFSHTIDNLSSLSASASSSTVDYKYFSNSGYTANDISLGYSKRVASGSVNLNVGRSFNDPDRGEKTTGTTWSAGYSGMLSRQNVSINLSRAINDNAITIAPSSGLATIRVRDIRKTTSASLGVSRSLTTLSSVSFNLNHSEQRSNQIGIDRVTFSSLSYGRKLPSYDYFISPSVSLRYDFSKQSRDRAIESDFEYTTSASISGSIMEGLALSFSLQNKVRKGNRSASEENTAKVGLAWALF